MVASTQRRMRSMQHNIQTHTIVIVCVGAFRDHDDSDSDNQMQVAAVKERLQVDDGEFEELKNFTQEDNVDSRRNRDQHERLIEDSEMYQ